MRDSLVIEGGQRVEGKVRVSGAKNASLVIIAASILGGGRVRNVPGSKMLRFCWISQRIRDVKRNGQ